MTLTNSDKSLHRKPKVVLVHGAIRRRSTSVWMEALKSYLVGDGFSVECFFWSGIPLSFATRAASRKLVAHLKRSDNQSLAIWCKSTGADVVNLAARQIRPDLIVQVAPTFVASTQLDDIVPRITVRLENDTFLNFWEKKRLVHQLDYAQEKDYVIVGPPNISHHDLNHPEEVVLSTGRTISLYSLYSKLLDATNK